MGLLDYTKMHQDTAFAGLVDALIDVENRPHMWDFSALEDRIMSAAVVGHIGIDGAVLTGRSIRKTDFLSSMWGDFWKSDTLEGSPRWKAMMAYVEKQRAQLDLWWNDKYVKPVLERYFTRDPYTIYPYGYEPDAVEFYSPEPQSIRAQLQDIRAGKYPRLDSRFAKRMLRFDRFLTEGDLLRKRAQPTGIAYYLYPVSLWSQPMWSQHYLTFCAYPKFKEPTIK